MSERRREACTVNYEHSSYDTIKLQPSTEHLVQNSLAPVQPVRTREVVIVGKRHLSVQTWSASKVTVARFYRVFVIMEGVPPAKVVPIAVAVTIIPG